MAMLRLIFEKSITEAIHDVARRIQAGSPFVPSPEFVVSLVEPEMLPQGATLKGKFVLWELNGAELRLQCKISGLGAVSYELSCCVGVLHGVDVAQRPAFLLAVNQAFPLMDSSFSVSLEQDGRVAIPPTVEAVALTPAVEPAAASAKEEERARREARAAKFGLAKFGLAKFGLAASVLAAEETAASLKAHDPVSAAAPTAAQLLPGDKLSAASPWGQRSEPIANSRRPMVMQSVACVFFARGACVKGAACQFSHETATPEHKTVAQEMQQEKKLQRQKKPQQKPERKPVRKPVSAQPTSGRHSQGGYDPMAPGPSPMDTATGMTNGGKISKQRRRRGQVTALRARAPEFVPAAHLNP